MRTQTLAQDRLKPGAWYSINFGLSRMNVCVLWVDEDLLLWEHPGWMYCDSNYEDFDTFFNSYRDPRFIGYGKKRPIGSVIRKATGCFCTIYTKP